MKLWNLFNRKAPASAAVNGFLLYFAVWYLLLPIAVSLRQNSHHSTWPQPGQLAIGVILSLSLAGAVFGGVFFYRLIRTAFPRLPVFGAKLWSFLLTLFLPLSPLLLLLPCAIRRRNRTGLVLALTAGLYNLTLIPLLATDAANWSHFRLVIAVWLGILFFLIALKAAAPAEKWTWGSRIFVLSVLAFFTGLEIYAWPLDKKIAASVTELEKSFGGELSVARYFREQREAASLSEEPWKTLLAATFPAGDYAQLEIPRLPTPEEIQTFENDSRKCPDCLAAADEVTGRRPYRLNPDSLRYGIRLLEQLQHLALYYGFKLRVAAAQGDRDGVIDASKRIERLSEFAGSDGLLYSWYAYEIENIRRLAFAPVLPAEVLSAADLADLMTSFRLSDNRLRRRYETALRNEVILSWYRHLCSQNPDYDPESNPPLRLSPPLFEMSPLLYLKNRLEQLHTLRYYLSYRDITSRPERDIKVKIQQLEALEKSFSYRFFLSGNIQPHPTTLFQLEYSQSDRTAVAILAIAVERFRRRHGELPEFLEELSPEFLPVIPVDRYGHPFRYEHGSISVLFDDIWAEEHQGYRVYQIFPDGYDPGGISAENFYTVILTSESR